MTNKGVEFNLNAEPAKQKDLTWDVNLTTRTTRTLLQISLWFRMIQPISAFPQQIFQEARVMHL